MRQAILQQPSPSLYWKQPRVRTSGEKIERQSVAAAIDEILAARLRRRHRHLDAVVAVVVMKSRRGVGRHRHAVGKASRDRNTPCPAGPPIPPAPDPFLGPHHS